MNLDEKRDSAEPEAEPEGGAEARLMTPLAQAPSPTLDSPSPLVATTQRLCARYRDLQKKDRAASASTAAGPGPGDTVLT
jgi:hypothetical protein